jgi:hypothetical protein
MEEYSNLSGSPCLDPDEIIKSFPQLLEESLNLRAVLIN